MTVSQALFSFEGRMSRRDFWLKGYLILLPINILNCILFYSSDNAGAQTVSIIISLLLLIPNLALYIKRLHDHNQSGWFLVTLLIPIANFFFLIWILFKVWFLRGTFGPNRFGDNPIEGQIDYTEYRKRQLDVGLITVLIVCVIFIDQTLKFWIKTTYPFGHVMDVLGLRWFKLYFIENEGMAWGWKFGGEWGKMILTLFRLGAVIFGTWYLGRVVKQGYHRGFIICAALIYAGALGNLIDSMFYGMIFSHSDYSTVATAFPSEGYASFLHGRVVDMLYFPIIKSHYPGWFPFVGGDDFEFFSPIFNIADASISIGVITLLLFQKRFFRKVHKEEKYSTIETSAEVSDKMQVS